jgi:Auxin response factor
MVSFLCTMYSSLYVHYLCTCRSSSADYIIPFGKFTKSLGNPLSIGMRFKMRYESEDSAEKRLQHSISHLTF